MPIRNWAPDAVGEVLVQAANLSRLPFAIHHIALMPDAHVGYGMPIGGVLFADGAVVPYGIGVDIGCGVALATTDVTVEQLTHGTLERVLGEIERRVPTGTKSHTRRIDRGRAEADIGRPPPPSIAEQWFARALQQLGTLGSGNHFLELQRDDAGAVYVMLHSGSRSLGKAICDAFHRRALATNASSGVALPHRDLAYLAADGADGRDYWSAMEYALRFAEVNRQRMLDQVQIAFERHTTIGRFDRRVDVHHNYAARERHFGRDGIVHRKGAVRARVGETVLIPGSMGTASYVAEGLGNPDAFESCQHGAGRAMSRGAARKAMSSAELLRQMDRLGVKLFSGEPRSAAEEAPMAYKDIETVMARSADLVRPVTRLTPLGVVKG
ncbi:MAG: RtcB family protein [Chloroflexota bacterium]|nr:RtcB family protein [Chloroflexota bacterium]